MAEPSPQERLSNALQAFIQECNDRRAAKRRAAGAERTRKCRAKKKAAMAAAEDSSYCNANGGAWANAPPPDAYFGADEPPDVAQFEPPQPPAMVDIGDDAGQPSRADQRERNIQGIQDVLYLEFMRSKGMTVPLQPLQAHNLTMAKTCPLCNGGHWIHDQIDSTITLIDVPGIIEFKACHYHCANPQCQYVYRASDPLTYTTQTLLPTAPKTTKAVVSHAIAEHYLYSQLHTPSTTIASFLSALARKVGRHTLVASTRPPHAFPCFAASGGETISRTVQSSA